MSDRLELARLQLRLRSIRLGLHRDVSLESSRFSAFAQTLINEIESRKTAKPSTDGDDLILRSERFVEGWRAWVLSNLKRRDR